MKNLIIIGIPRAGKTTLAQTVAREIGAAGHAVSVVSADALVGGLTQVYKRNLFYAGFIRPLKHVFRFLDRQYTARLIRDLHIMAGRFLNEQADVSTVIYEDAYLTVDRAIKLFDKKRFKIVAIGYPNANPDEKMADIRRHDGNTPANRMDDAELRKFVDAMMDNSRRLAHDAMKCKIPFIDTSVDYRGAIDDFAKNVIKFLK